MDFLSGLSGVCLHPTLRQMDSGPSALLPLDPGVQAPSPLLPQTQSLDPTPLLAPNTGPLDFCPQTQDSRPPAPGLHRLYPSFQDPLQISPQNHSPVSPALLSPSRLRQASGGGRWGESAAS